MILLGAASANDGADQVPSDYRVVNARIRTIDHANGEAVAMVVRGGRVAAVGAAADAEEHAGLPSFDLGGRTVVPGFVDAHTHPGSVAKSSWHVALPQTSDIDELLEFMRRYAEAHPPSEVPFLYFEYFFIARISAENLTKELLDTAVSDRPAMCQDFGEHTHWLNSKMLELMGVDEHTPDPVPGLKTFDRNQDGTPRGLAREDAHLRFVDNMYDALGWSPERDVASSELETFLSYLVSNGVVAVFDALLEGDDVLEALAVLEERGRLLVHYEAAVLFDGLEELDAALQRARDLDYRFGSDLIRVRTLKLFLDGTNESGNSAVIEPLCGGHRGAADRGSIRMDGDQLCECLLRCQEAGVDLHVHLVGDRAFRVACDAVEAARASTEAAGSPWTVQVTFAHCELVDPLDMARPAELGIIVNWSPHWSGGYFGDGAKALLGADRWDRMYRFNEIIDSGAVVTFSSDVVTSYEHERAAPFFGMQVAATRVDPEVPLDPDRYPGSVRPSRDAAIDLATLVRGYTAAAAQQLRLDDRLGSLEVGKLATFNVLDVDPWSVADHQLSAVRCDAVVVGGRVVRGSFS